MISTVRLYYNTGLTVNNCLDSIGKLDTLGFAHRDFSSIAIKQNRGLISIKIDTQYSNVCDADYCKIDNIGYWITGIEMLNDNVAMILLQQDYLTTVGVPNIQVVSGWCTRRCVTDDTVFKNIIDEPFTPMEELVVDGCTEISNGTTDTGHINVLLANIDILNLDAFAKAYVNPGDTKEKVLVPQLPAILGDTTKYTFHPNGLSHVFTTGISMTTAYNPNSNNVKEAVAQIRSLGIESCVGASYQLPKQWVTATENNGVYSLLVDNWANVRSKITPQYGSYKNKKVYTGQFHRYIVYSICSGARSEFRIEDIIDQNNNIDWTVFADLRYNGYPGCKPAVYRGKSNDSMFGCIKGAGWTNTPFMYTSGVSGYDRLISDAAVNYREGLIGTATQTLGSNADTFNSFLTAGATSQASGSNITPDQFAAGQMGLLSGWAGRQVNIINNAFSNKRAFSRNIQQAFRVQPDLKFPLIPSMQDFVGNKFYELSYRLSDKDSKRFDDFLTMFGYSVSEPLTTDCFSGRVNFNYVEASDVNINCGDALYLRDGVAQQLEAGVRIWHTKPSHTSLLDNPIA